MPKQDLKGVTDLAKIQPEDIDSIGEAYGHRLADRREGIKTNQIRNIYSSILALRTKLSASKEFENEWENSIHSELVLIKPKLAYASGRQKNVKPLYELLKDGIDAVVNSGDKKTALKNFIQLVESIVAYHKFYGGN